MTITEPDAAAPPSTTPSPAIAVQPRGLYQLVTTGDHTTLGRLYVLFSVLFLVAAGVLATLTSIEKLDTTSTDLFGGVTASWQVFTASRVTLVLCGVLPLFVGLATAVVPLQVGSPAIAFPRAAAAAFWAWLLGVGLLIGGYAADGGFGEAPGFTGGASADGVALTLLAVGLLIVSLLLATVCIVTTVVSLRTPGMTLRRVPAFSWSMLVAGTVWFLTLPVLFARIVLAYVDFTHSQTLFGADTVLYDQVRWFFGQPTVYLLAIPALGIVSEIVAVAAGVRQRLYDVLLGAIGLFGLLAVGSFASAGGLEDTFVYIAFGYAILVPALAVFALWADTLRQGMPRTSGPIGAFALALLGAVILLAGVVAGALNVLVPLDLAGTSAVDGHFLIIALSSVMIGVGGIVYWSSKLTGRPVLELGARLVALPLAGGALLAGGGDFVAGFFDQPTGFVTGAVRSGAEAMNVVGLIGTLLFLVGIVLALALVAATFVPGPRARANPWDGHTLEWAAGSPPAVGNFREALPLVQSERPLLDRSDNGGAA